MLHVSVLCFTASYILALGLEVWHLIQPRLVLRMTAIAAAAAGLLAQTIYLAVKPQPIAWQFGFLLLVAWVLVVFYVAGALHHARLAWGVFVLPLVLGLLALGGIGVYLNPGTETVQTSWATDLFSFQRAHEILLLLAAIGLCIGFLASLMYLVQAHRLKAKILPGKGLKLLSLERLEAMNRRAVTLAFHLLTIGMIIGAALLVVKERADWTDPLVLAAFVLWIIFALLLYLRYATHLRGRPAALLTILTFVLLLCCLTLSHPVGQGGGR
jgi:ABC-type transport system involved in cytochrome c biogenesis permease subunit